MSATCPNCGDPGLNARAHERLRSGIDRLQRVEDPRTLHPIPDPSTAIECPLCHGFVYPATEAPLTMADEVGRDFEMVLEPA